MNAEHSVKITHLETRLLGSAKHPHEVYVVTVDGWQFEFDVCETMRGCFAVQFRYRSEWIYPYEFQAFPSEMAAIWAGIGWIAEHMYESVMA